MAKRWVDDFNRANGELAASTLSGGGATWLAPADEAFAVLNNRASAIDATDGFNTLAIVDTDADSDALFSRVQLATWQRPAGSALAWRLYAAVDGDVLSGYMARYEEYDEGAVFLIRQLAADIDLLVEDVASGLYDSGLLELRVDPGANEISVCVNDVVVLGPIPLADEPTGVGNRRVGFGMSWDAGEGSGTRIVEFDNFVGGDLVHLTAISQRYQRNRRMA